MFELEADLMEFGLGIHGEPGFERSQYKTAKEVAKLLLEKLENSRKLNLQKGSVTDEFTFEELLIYTGLEVGLLKNA